MNEIDHLKEKLLQLRLKTISQNLDFVLEEARQKNLSAVSILSRLADLELEQRHQAAIVECQDIDNKKMCQHIDNKVL